MSMTMLIIHGLIIRKGLFQPHHVAEINQFLKLFEEWQFENVRK